MEQKMIIQTTGGVAKEESLFTLGNHIMPNTFVLENEEPYPGYHGSNLPKESKPISLFLMTKKKYSTERILRITQKIKKYFEHPFDAVPGTICINNDIYPCIRIRDLDNYDLVGELQKCFFSEGISFMKSKKIQNQGVITLKKLFNLEKIEKGFYKDLDDDATYYIQISKQLSYQEFVKVIKKVRNNIEAEKTNFDAALAAVYTREILDMIRIYHNDASLAYLKELKTAIEAEIKRME